ncbi:hypothetical protein TwortDSMZ_160 [Staphylococcus phage Twort]|uniref:ORF047 n=2 Tax=Staphylococcus phage Twort (strain DSM 17442 / HER 48) TaxID=2908167 RepID=Q4Z985_BPTWO|nr:hypothetical protein TwortORF047 [Staphylococcus phage Twort]AAX92342.1 ORF047 [Staphylococcus phage Twort]QIW89158.1 hypothetical protein TwortDSMZ_160 [Staphylococcus phage Twort]
MLIIYNKNHIQSKEVHKHLGYSVNENVCAVVNNQDAIKVVKESQDTDIMLVGFIYTKDLECLVELGKTIYWVSNIGTIPSLFKHVDNSKIKSLLEQAVELLPEEYGVFEYTKESMKKATDYYNFKNDDYLEEVDIDKDLIDMLAKKCYTNGDLHFLYELDPKLRLPIAYSITRGKDKAIVVIGSQTASDNDMLSFYVKGYDVSKLANTFNAEYEVGNNTFTTFIPSHINVVGKSIKKYMEDSDV